MQPEGTEVEKTVALNTEIPASLKKKLNLYCATEDVYIKDAMKMILEDFFSRNQKV